jgi:hypothetical protein
MEMYWDAESGHAFWKGAVRRAKAPRIALHLGDDQARGECPSCGHQVGAVPVAKEGDDDFEEEEEEEEGEEEEEVAPGV